MPDLNDLSPAALAAAMKGGTSTWGEWGSVAHHALYVELRHSATRRRLCRCGCRKWSTHVTAANGVCLATGCELSMRRWAKEMTARGSSPS